MNVTLLGIWLAIVCSILVYGLLVAPWLAKLYKRTYLEGFKAGRAGSALADNPHQRWPHRAPWEKGCWNGMGHWGYPGVSWPARGGIKARSDG